MDISSIKVLIISSDRDILSQGSAVSERMKEYGALVKELHIVLLSDSSHRLRETQLDKNVWVYPTNSLLKFFRPLNAAGIGKKIVLQKAFVRGRSVISAQDPFECGWAALKIKEKWRLPLEVQLHTNPFSRNFSGFQNRIRKLLARRVLRSADSVRVVSEELRIQISQLTSASVGVLPIYIDKNKIVSNKISFDVHARYGWRFVILAVARLSPEKDLATAIRALSIVRQTFPDTGLLIVGRGKEERKLRSLTKKLSLDGYVEFAGWQENLASFYGTSNLFIQTSFFEGYGMALVEAALSGLPVITTPVGIASELQDGLEAKIVPFGRADLFASGILDLLEHNQMRESMRFNLKRAIESKLISKEEYLEKMKANWELTAKSVPINK